MDSRSVPTAWIGNHQPKGHGHPGSAGAGARTVEDGVSHPIGVSGVFRHGSQRTPRSPTDVPMASLFP